MIFNRRRAMAEAVALTTVHALAAKVGWRFGRGPLPSDAFAQYLHVEDAHLLIVPTSAGLPFAMRQAGRVARETCSDALIVSHADVLSPTFALATWSPAETVWTEPLSLWLADSGELWLTPSEKSEEAFGFRLANALHHAEPVPWHGAEDRVAGYAAARDWYDKGAQRGSSRGRHAPDGTHESRPRH